MKSSMSVYVWRIIIRRAPVDHDIYIARSRFSHGIAFPSANAALKIHVVSKYGQFMQLCGIIWPDRKYRAAVRSFSRLLDSITSVGVPSLSCSWQSARAIY